MKGQGSKRVKGHFENVGTDVCPALQNVDHKNSFLIRAPNMGKAPNLK